uniref:Uncharacterized protein n=1 Tax=Anguilla anguilla TaxID=7936 RepID=A0A0E9TGE4_ANGAN
MYWSMSIFYFNPFLLLLLSK